jgi:microsomal epoxide hydrolase
VYRYWLDTYDWRKHEALINQFAHYRTEIEGLKVCTHTRTPEHRTGLQVHYIHAQPPPSRKYKRIVPLVLVHGWPGSVYEFMRILPMLTDPATALPGADTSLAFEVVVPSIPGYAWSDAPAKMGMSMDVTTNYMYHCSGFSTIECARIFHKLMQRLKHRKYYAQGGDWGSAITTNMAILYPDKCVAHSCVHYTHV